MPPVWPMMHVTIMHPSSSIQFHPVPGLIQAAGLPGSQARLAALHSLAVTSIWQPAIRFMVYSVYVEVSLRMAPLVGIAWQILAANFFSALRFLPQTVSVDRKLERSSQFEKSEVCGQYANKPENDALDTSHKCQWSTQPNATLKCWCALLILGDILTKHHATMETPRFCLKHPETCRKVGRPNLGTQSHAVSRCLGHR